MCYIRIGRLHNMYTYRIFTIILVHISSEYTCAVLA